MVIWRGWSAQGISTYTVDTLMRRRTGLLEEVVCRHRDDVLVEGGGIDHLGHEVGDGARTQETHVHLELLLHIGGEQRALTACESQAESGLTRKI